MMAYPQANTLVVRKVYDTLRDSCYALLEKVIHILGVEKQWKCVRSPLEMVYLPTGQKILFRGLDDPYKLSSLTVTHGVLCWGWLEEAYQISNEEDFDLIDQSLRGTMPEGLWIRWMIIFNPWNKSHWLRTKFFEEEDGTPLVDPMICAFRTNYLINEWLTEADKRFFERMKELNPKQYDVAGLGNWGTPEGMIYDNWEELNFDYNKVAKIPDIQSICGLDFGFSADPTAMACLLVDNANYTIYVYDEIYERGLTSKERAKRIKEKGHAKSEIVYDSANPLDAQELLEEGILNLIPANKTATSILNGINRIRDYKIYIHPRCVNFLIEIQNYAWFVDKNGITQPKPAPGSMDHCLVKGTMVTTINGDIPIEEVKVGDYVLTHKGYRKVVASGITQFSQPIYRMELTDDRVLEGTYDHPIMTDNGFKSLYSITQSNEVYIWRMKSNMTEGCGEDGKESHTICQTIRDCTSTFGRSITDLYQKVCKSITLTAIKPTTTSATLNCVRHRNITTGIPGRKSASNVRKNIWQDNRISAEHGTSQRKVISGMSNTLNNRSSERDLTSVNIAENSSSRSHTEQTNSVQTIVNQPNAERMEQTISQNNVKYAERSSQSTGIQRPELVPVNVRTVYATGRNEDVYDLTVEDAHTFFANGILVHNCMDAMRYAMMGVAITGRGGFIGSVEEDDWKERYKYDVPTDDERQESKEMVLYAPKYNDDEDDNDEDDDEDGEDDDEYGYVYST